MLPENGLGSVSKYGPTDSLYIKLEQFMIPSGWSNDPLCLHLACCSHRRVVEENLMKEFKTQFNLPNPLPILVNIQYRQYRQYGQQYRLLRRLMLIDGGNEKFYVWQDIENCLGEFYERDLAMLLFAIGKDPDYTRLQWRKLGHLRSRHADFDAPWN